MNKWILIAIIIVLVAGFGLILFRHDLPVWKDIWAYTIVPVAAPYWNMTLNLVRENPIQTLGGMLGGFSALGGLLYKAIGQINVLKTKATEKINEVTSQKDQVTQELYAMEQQFTQEKDTLLTENTDLKSALNDANPLITQLQGDLETMTQQYNDARVQIDTLNHAIENMDKKVQIVEVVK
jgi:hypothetical protein